MNKLGENKEQYIDSIFKSIAHRYDFINRIISFNLDSYWRNVAIKKSGAQNSNLIVDVCAGTGELSVNILRKVGLGCKIFSVDRCREMLMIGKNKFKKMKLNNIVSIQGDAQFLPFEDGYFDIAISGYGLRNVKSIQKTLNEMKRVVKSNGRVVILELSEPEGSFGYLYNIYWKWIMPIIGRIMSGQKGPYEYLSDSLNGYLSKEELMHLMKNIGLKNIEITSLFNGAVAIHTGVK